MSKEFLLRETGSEVSVEWRIERFLFLTHEFDCYLHSPAFALSDAQWFLEIWPNGDAEDYSFGWISLFLCKRFSTSKKHDVKFTLGIQTKNGSKLESFDSKHEFEKCGGQGCRRLILASELRELNNVFSSDETLTVFATLRSAEPTVLDEAKVIDMPREVTFRETHPEVSLDWKVERFTSLPKECGFSIKSPAISLACAEWCLQLYPNGYSYEYLNWLSLFLSRERSSSEKQTVAFTLGIRKSDGTPYRLSHYEVEFDKNTNWGNEKFLNLSEFYESESKLLYEGSITLFCTVRANPSPWATGSLTERGAPTFSHTRQEERASQTSPSEGYKNSQPSCVTLQENFRNLFLNERLGDVTIQVQQDQKLQAHRAILAARSPIFSAMFEHDTEEKRTGIVNADDFDAASFRAFLSFLYSADVEVVSADNALPLYKAAYKYNIQDLKNESLRYLQDVLSVQSFCEVAQLAFMHSETSLLETTTQFFVDNAKEIIVNPDWQVLMIKHPALTNELFFKMATKRL